MIIYYICLGSACWIYCAAETNAQAVSSVSKKMQQPSVDLAARLAQVFAHAFSLQDPMETLSRFYKVLDVGSWAFLYQRSSQGINCHFHLGKGN